MKRIYDNVQRLYCDAECGLESFYVELATALNGLKCPMCGRGTLRAVQGGSLCLTESDETWYYWSSSGELSDDNDAFVIDNWKRPHQISALPHHAVRMKPVYNIYTEQHVWGDKCDGIRLWRLSYDDNIRG